MIARGDVYQLSYEDIKTIFRNHSRAAKKKGRGSQPMASTSSSNLSIKGEIGNMLEDFKTDTMQTLALQLDTMNIKTKQEEAERALAIFCPRCTRRHPKNEFPLNCIKICLVCKENHSIDKCPSLPRLKAIYQGDEGSLSSFATSTKGDLRGLGHTSRVCKGHPMHITTPTKPQLYLHGDPLLILLGLHPLLGPIHLSINPNQPASHFNLMFSHNISGIPHTRGGSPNSIMFQPYCLHHLPNHNSCTLLHLSNPRCLPSQN